MGSIKDPTSVLAIANYVELRRTKVNRMEWNIDRTMEYGQSRLIDWDHMAKVKEVLLGNPLDGRLQLLVWDDKGMGMPLRNSINVVGVLCLPCVMWHAVVISGSAAGHGRPTGRCGM